MSTTQESQKPFLDERNARADLLAQLWSEITPSLLPDITEHRLESALAWMERVQEQRLEQSRGLVMQHPGVWRSTLRQMRSYEQAAIDVWERRST